MSKVFHMLSVFISFCTCYKYSVFSLSIKENIEISGHGEEDVSVVETDHQKQILKTMQR